MSSWALHPSGVYKNHAMSSRMLYAALSRTFLAMFMEPEQGYGKKKGESVTITRSLQLPAATRTVETEGIPTVDPEQSTVSATVSPWAIKIETTEFEETLAHFDLKQRNQRLLRNNIELTLDNLGAETLIQTPVKFTPSTTGGAFDTDGTLSNTANSNMNIANLKSCMDYLVQDLKAPPFDNGKYVGLFTTQAARGLKNSTEAATWLAPTQQTAFKRGTLGADVGIPTGYTPRAQFLGTVENCDIYETNNLDVLRRNLGTGNVCGEGLIFGMDPMFLAQAQAPELRADPSTELGTKRAVGWVGIFEAGLCWPEASLARVIHVTSL